MMDSHTFEENWTSICRKFPVVCVLNLGDRNSEEARETLKSHSVQFDHVVALSDAINQKDMIDFFQRERVINVTIARSNDLQGITDEDKVKSYIRGNVLILSSKLERLTSNIRWSVYDRIKEMKSPLKDRIFLDENTNYCSCEEAKLTVILRLS